MPSTVKLASKLKQRLPKELVGLVEAVGAMAAHQGQHLYLVGGVVRDLLLERETFDLDLVTDGDATSLAQLLANMTQARLVRHARFKTANLRWKEWSIDLATARAETYDRPGALPRVRPGSLANDLFRRDFTVNAMAVHLNPASFGELVDPHGGRADLEAGLIRVLHKKSFVDDATRIWRALRYEQRLGLRLEPETEQLIARDIAMLDTISGDRLRHELELVLKEAHPEKALSRADELGVLTGLQPGLKAGQWLAGRFEQARQLTSPALPSVGLYLALLAYPLQSADIEQMVSRLRFPRRVAQTLQDTVGLKARTRYLAAPDTRPSLVYSALHGHSPLAITAVMLASSTQVASNIRLYLNRLRYVKPALTGDDLKAMGIPPGPRLRETLDRLRAARLDGEVSDRPGEEQLVKEW